MDQPRADSWAWRAVYSLVLAVVLVAFLYSVRAVLNPLFLFLLILLLAAPFAGGRSHRVLMVAMGMITLLWLLATLGSLLAPFFLALGLAYVLHPPVRRIERRGVSRGLAIALLSIPMVVGLVLVIFVGMPALGRQIAGLIQGVPQALQSVVAWAEWMQMELARRDWPYLDENALLARLRSVQPDAVLHFLQARQAEIGRRAWQAVIGAGKGVSFALTILGYLFLTPILAFYLLRDWERITTSLAGLMPGLSRARVVTFFQRYDLLLAGYIRGTLLEASIVGVLTSVLLWLVGIPYALLLGVMAAVFNIIPYVGLVLTLIPAMVVALFTGNVLLSLGKVVLVFGVVQVIDGAIIGPKVLGESVGLHPVWVILALSVAGFFWGFVGLLLAVPLAVLVKLLLELAMTRYRRSAFYVAE